MIRFALPEEFEKVYEVYKKSFDIEKDSNEIYYRQLIKNNINDTLIFTMNSEIISMITLSKSYGNQVDNIPGEWLTNACTNEDRRNKGFFAMILREAEKTLFEAGTSRINIGSQPQFIPMYERLGYEMSGEYIFQGGDRVDFVLFKTKSKYEADKETNRIFTAG